MRCVIFPLNQHDDDNDDDDDDDKNNDKCILLSRLRHVAR